MIKTATSFITDNKYLQAIYDSAERVLLSSVKAFGDRRVLTTSPSSETMTLNSEVLGASTLAAYDTEAAMNTVLAFLATQREDGRLADGICCHDGSVAARYDALTGFCFAEEALGLYYLTRKKDDQYLDALLAALERFDAYLWEHHDLNFNNCLEVFGETETEEGAGTGRFTNIKVDHYGEIREVSPFPIESGDLMACDVAIRHTIARIYMLRGDSENAKEWNLKAINVQSHLKQALWVGGSSACFDRDYRGSIIDVLSINNLFMMYYGAFDLEMANAFVTNHMSDPRGFATAFPLPSVAFRDRHFVNDDRPNFNGQPRGMSYRRAIGALEKYGYFSLLTEIGTKFLSSVGEHCAYTEQFNPFTGEPVRKSAQSEYMPTASAALEFVARFFGVRQQLDRLHWGALGHIEGYTSEYRFTWGGDTFRLVAESGTSSGLIGDKPLFTVTNGMRVITDLHGNSPRVINVKKEPIDGVLVYRDRTYSFSLAPDEVFDVSETRTDDAHL